MRTLHIRRLDCGIVKKRKPRTCFFFSFLWMAFHDVVVSFKISFLHSVCSCNVEVMSVSPFIGVLNLLQRCKTCSPAQDDSPLRICFLPERAQQEIAFRLRNLNFKIGQSTPLLMLHASRHRRTQIYFCTTAVDADEQYHTRELVGDPWQKSDLRYFGMNGKYP